MRFISFCASGFFAGIAGGLFAINFEILTEENLNLATSGSILLITFLGGVGFFIGPIIGAIVFTLLQTVLSLYTEIWQLYVGTLFLLTVMFFPFGLTGLIAMHFRPYKLGKISILYKSYLRMFVPAIVCILSLSSLLEIAFHAKHTAIGEEQMSLFWISFNSHGVLPWLVVIVLAIGSGWMIKNIAPDLKEAWDVANYVEPRT